MLGEREFRLIDGYLAALYSDPLAEPPAGLDSAGVALARALAIKQRKTEPDQPTLARIWQRILTEMALALLVLAGFLTLSRGGNGFTLAASSEALVGRYVEQVWNDGDLFVLDDLLAIDHVYLEPGMSSGVAGVGAVAAAVTNYRTAFPDLHVEVKRVAVTGDRVRASLVATGTHTVPSSMPRATSRSRPVSGYRST